MTKKLLAFLLSSMLVAYLVFLPGCATEPEPLVQVQPETLHKSMFEGQWYYKATVTDTSWDNIYTFIGEEAYSFNPTIRWEITENLLNGYQVPEMYQDANGNWVESPINNQSLMLSFAILSHFDIKYLQNSTTRENLNVIIENTSDRPWWEREYIRVDWSKSLVSPTFMMPMGFSLLDSSVRVEPVSVLENVEFFNHDDEVVATRSWHPGDKEIYAFNVDTKDTIMPNYQYWWEPFYGRFVPQVTVKFRHGFMRAKPVNETYAKTIKKEIFDGMIAQGGLDEADKATLQSAYIAPMAKGNIYNNNYVLAPDTDVTPLPAILEKAKFYYKPLDYDDDSFRRFGYFRTEYSVYDTNRALIESNKKYWVNRWLVNNYTHIDWWLSPTFPVEDQNMVLWTKEIVLAWNKSFDLATPGRVETDDVVRLHYNVPLFVDANGNRLDVRVYDDGENEGKFYLYTASDGKSEPTETLLEGDGDNFTVNGQPVSHVFNLDGTMRYRYELGDMRYSFINYTTHPGDETPLGYGPTFSDQSTGQTLSGSLNVYGNWVDYVVERSLDYYDVVAGNCSLNDMKNGKYFNEKTGQCDGGNPDYFDDHLTPYVDSQMHSIPIQNGYDHINPLTTSLMAAYYPPVPEGGFKKVREVMARDLPAAKDKATKIWNFQLQNPVALMKDKTSILKGTSFDGMMAPHASYRTFAPYATSDTDKAVTEFLSPSYRLSSDVLNKILKQETGYSVCRLEPDNFDNNVLFFIEENKNKSRAEIREELRKWVYYDTALHEMGHTFGLRHNFEGSVDRDNFPPEYWTAYNNYWDEIEKLREDYQDRIDAGDTVAYKEYVTKVHNIPSNHERFATTSIMDYTGDWEAWLSKAAGSYDDAAIAFAYGQRVEICEKLDTEGVPCKQNSDWTWTDYKSGDFKKRFDVLTASGGTYANDPDALKGRNPKASFYYKDLKSESGRLVKTYMFCSDEKTEDDFFCTRFDKGTTATEITENLIQFHNFRYFLTNFKRDREKFGGWSHFPYYWNKWWRIYLVGAKSIVDFSINGMRYSNYWSDSWDAMDSISTRPAQRDMVPGYMPDGKVYNKPNGGAEDLMRATFIFYYHMIYDVLMRPDYGIHVVSYDPSGRKFFESTQPDYVAKGDIVDYIEVGDGWAWNDQWDSQLDYDIYYDKQIRIGTEFDKYAVLEILSLPAIFNSILEHEKANGLSYWNSLWTNNGQMIWEIIRGMIDDVHTHKFNPYCMKVRDEQAYDPANPEKTFKLGDLQLNPIPFTENYSYLFNGDFDFKGTSRCPEGYIPVGPAMDQLFAINPMFWGIDGASHPWYTNNLVDFFDSQVKGDTKFAIPEGAVEGKDYVEFTNSTGMRTYQALKPRGGYSISYEMVSIGRRIEKKLKFLQDCYTGVLPDTATYSFEFPYGSGKQVTRSCSEVVDCVTRTLTVMQPDYCAPEDWNSLYVSGLDNWTYSDLDRIEAMLIMMQDMVRLVGHMNWPWETPGLWYVW